MSLDEKILVASGDMTRLERPVREIGDVFPRRVSADPETVERGLAQLVLTLVELLRQLMERQALRRMDAGTLDDDEIERLGRTFMKLAERMDELKAEFGLRDEDLNLDLGPLGRLI
jgi:uncharacterized protein YjiS (DUF1127 family)